MELENRIANGSTRTLSGASPGVDTSANAADAGGLEERANDAKAQIRSFADTGKDRIAERLDQVARALRSTGDALRAEEDAADVSQYADVIGDKVEEASRFLRTHETTDLADELERVARRQPLVFLGGVFVAGLAIGRFLKSKPPEVSAPQEDEPRSAAENQEHYAVANYREYPDPEESKLSEEPASFDALDAVPDGSYRGPGDSGPTS